MRLISVNDSQIIISDVFFKIILMQIRHSVTAPMSAVISGIGMRFQLAVNKIRCSSTRYLSVKNGKTK